MVIANVTTLQKKWRQECVLLDTVGIECSHPELKRILSSHKVKTGDVKDQFDLC